MNYLNDIENNKNYLGNEPVIRDLMDVGGIPSRLFDTSSYPLLTHMRVAYGRVNWDDFVVELDQQTINNLLAIYRDCDSYRKKLESLKPGMKVMIVDGDSMTPVTYNGLIKGTTFVEVLTYDDAINKAAEWLEDDLLDGYGGFSLTTIYYLVAFRLALMDGDMSDEERFAKSRISKVWRHTYAHMISLVAQKLEDAAIEIAKSSYRAEFFLDDDEVEKYIASLNEDYVAARSDVK
jgi:hypothetical protein